MTIRSEIETRLSKYASSKNIPVAYQNITFKKPTTGYYLEIIFLASNSSNRDVSAENITNKGLFQINCYGQLGSGMKGIEELAQDIINLYPVLPKEGLVSIESPLSSASAYVAENFICVPITGKYRAEF